MAIRFFCAHCRRWEEGGSISWSARLIHRRRGTTCSQSEGETPKESAQRATHDSNTEKMEHLSITPTPTPSIDDTDEIDDTDDMDTGENSVEIGHVSLDHALHQKLALNRKQLKARHHIDYLDKYIEAGRMPTGLKLQFPEIHLMDSMSITQTRKKIADIHRQTEKSICTALIEHYTQVIQETKQQMDHVERAISSHMHKDPRGTSREHRRLLNKLERNEDSMEHNLQPKKKRLET